ncbi:MAG TPA: NrtA/SsuA/CpmA family ABC transporter substrate-binding protein [Chloroflexota bacterium]
MSTAARISSRCHAAEPAAAPRRRLGAGLLLALALALAVAACAPAPTPPASAPTPSAPAGATGPDATAPAATPPPETAHIKVMYASLAGSNVPIWVAQDRGYFQKYGLDADVSYATGNRPTLALVAGDADFISSAATASLPAAVAGSDLVFLAGATNVSPLEIFATAQITRPEDLRGKRVGITTFGSATDAGARFALNRWGLEVGRDVTLLQLGAQSELLAALSTGSIDAAVLSDPTTYAAHKAGYPRLAKLRDLGMSVQHVAIVSRRSYVDAHPDVTDRFLRAYGDAIRYVFTNRDGTLEVMAKYLKDMDSDLLSDAYDGLQELIPRVPYPTAEGIQVALDELAQTDERAKQMTAQDVMDTRFVEKLDHEGFFK